MTKTGYLIQIRNKFDSKYKDWICIPKSAYLPFEGLEKDYQPLVLDNNKDGYLEYKERISDKSELFNFTRKLFSDRRLETRTVEVRLVFAVKIPKSKDSNWMAKDVIESKEVTL